MVQGSLKETHVKELVTKLSWLLLLCENSQLHVFPIQPDTFLTLINCKQNIPMTLDLSEEGKFSFLVFTPEFAHREIDCVPQNRYYVLPWVYSGAVLGDTHVAYVKREMRN